MTWATNECRTASQGKRQPAETYSGGLSGHTTCQGLLLTTASERVGIPEAGEFCEAGSWLQQPRSSQVCRPEMCRCCGASRVAPCVLQQVSRQDSMSRRCCVSRKLGTAAKDKKQDMKAWQKTTSWHTALQAGVLGLRACKSCRDPAQHVLPSILGFRRETLVIDQSPAQLHDVGRRPSCWISNELQQRDKLLRKPSLIQKMVWKKLQSAALQIRRKVRP